MLPERKKPDNMASSLYLRPQVGRCWQSLLLKTHWAFSYAFP